MGIDSKMSALLGYLVPDAGMDSRFDHDRVLEAMSGELIFDPAAGRAQLGSGGFRALQLFHTVAGIECGPVTDEDSGLLLFLDGEIFGLPDLGRRPHGIEAGGPGPYPEGAAYCLDLYRRYGTDFFERLNGSFILLVYDLRKDEVTIASDRFASRPLYYTSAGGRLAFSTQPGPLLAFPGMTKNLNLVSVFQYFNFQRVFGNETFLEEMSALAPATVLRFGAGRVTLEPYWKLEYRPDYSRSKKQYSKALAGAFHDCIRDRMSGRGRVGVLLSGGMDSRMIMAAARGAGHIETITVADFYNLEARVAEEVARKAGSNHHFLQRSPDYYLSRVDEAVRIGGGMYRFDHAHFPGFMEDLRGICDVLVHGFFLDAVFRASLLPRRKMSFGGREFTLRAGLLPLPAGLSPEIFLEHMKYCLWRTDPKQLFKPPLREEFEESLKASIWMAMEGMPPDGLVHNRFEWFVVNHFYRYPSALLALSMRPFMDERPPFPDNRLLDLFSSMPPEYRADPMVWADAVKELDKEIAGIPLANTGLSPFAPFPARAARAVWLSRGKGAGGSLLSQDSWPNIQEMTRQNWKMRELILDTIGDPDCLDPSIFDTERIQEIAGLHFGGQGEYSRQLLLLVTFGRWHKLSLGGD